MTDYLINQYNDKIAAALEAKDAAIAAAVQTWLEASASAAIELAAALEHRNRVYVEGPPVIPPPSTEPTGNEFGVFGSVEPKLHPVEWREPEYQEAPTASEEMTHVH